MAQNCLGMFRPAQACFWPFDLQKLWIDRCAGYTLTSLQNTEHGITAHLGLAGEACNAFGLDINNLTIEVTYETQTRWVRKHYTKSPLTSMCLRLHVNVYDTAKTQFTVPENVVSRPPLPTSSHKDSSDLVFNHNAYPFAFWITRRSAPDAIPLFDTRIASLPPTPIPAPNPSADNSTAFDSFALVFEDQYVQVCEHFARVSWTWWLVYQLASALPKGANIYGLGEVVASSGLRRDIGTDGGAGTIQTLWARDIADPLDQNM
jgi:alpha-glucosidase